MMDTHAEILAALQKQEAVLQCLLQSVRQAIQSFQPDHPAKLRHTHTRDSVDLLMDQVLARLGEQFTSVEIFEAAKRVKPGFTRPALNSVMERLLRYGLIYKIEDGRGRRPARYHKQIVN
jgi:predicted transcriptional regulator